MEELQKDITKLAYQVTGADNHIKSRDSRIAQTPIKDGEWSGARGASKYTPTDLESKQLLSKYNQTYVSYDRSGEPNFEPFEVAHVKISDMSDNRSQNFSSMDKKLLQTEWAKKNNLHSEADVRKYRQEHHLTPHECSDGVTMRLVPEEINRRYGHSGGVAEIGAMNDPLDLHEDGILRTAGKIQGKTAVQAKKAVVEIEENIQQTGEKCSQGIDRLKTIDAMTPMISATNMVGDYGKEFTVGAAEAVYDAAFPLMVLGVQNICEVACGQKSMEDARKEMETATFNVALRGGGGKIAGKAIGELAQKTGSELLGFVSANVGGIVQVVNAGGLVLRSFNKLVNDEISGVEFFDEIGEQGVKLIGDFLGTAAGYGLTSILTASMAAGPAGLLVTAGAFVGGMIMSTVCVGIYRQTINLREQYRAKGAVYRNRISEINHIADLAIKEMEFQQAQLRLMIKEEYDEWDNKFNAGFQEIIDAMFTNDFEQLSEGLNHILSVFGEAALFKNMDEFDNFFFDDEAVLTL